LTNQKYDAIIVIGMKTHHNIKPAKYQIWKTIKINGKNVDLVVVQNDVTEIGQPRKNMVEIGISMGLKLCSRRVTESLLRSICAYHPKTGGTSICDVTLPRDETWWIASKFGKYSFDLGNFDGQQTMLRKLHRVAGRMETTDHYHTGWVFIAPHKRQ